MSQDKAAPAREADRPITFFGALRDLGFVSWLFVALVGAPSVVTLAQTLSDGLTLSDALQWLIDSYNQLLAALAVIVAPLVRGVAHLFVNLFGLDLEIHPHWRPLFVLAAIFVSANARTLWGDKKRQTAIAFVLVAVLMVLAASVVAGLTPPNAPWWAQGLTAAQFVVFIFAGFVVSYSIASVFFGFSQPYRKPLIAYARRGLFFGLAAFAIAAAISLSPYGAGGRAGVATIFGGLCAYGLYWIYYGFRHRDRPEIRFGLRVVGGFIFALLIILIDKAATAFA